MVRLDTYLYTFKDWPNLTWDSKRLESSLSNLRNLQGKLAGKMELLSFMDRNEVILESLTMEVKKSSEIEGEVFDFKQVRSSLARQLNMNVPGLIPSQKNVDGVVKMTLEAIENYDKKMTAQRLFSWHKNLFPKGLYDSKKLDIGCWRTGKHGEMQIVSGPMGKEKVHYQAPSANVLEDEMKRFINWFNDKSDMDYVIKSGVAHLYFILIHPFEDGNGRIARVLTDMLLARSENSSLRYYSMSSELKTNQKQYYNELEKAQSKSLDVTDWLLWFLDSLKNAIETSNRILENTFKRHQFWHNNSTKVKNERQIKVLNKLFDNFEGKLTSSKWAKMNKCSKDTAIRDIQDLINKGILLQNDAGGRSVSYRLVE